MSIFGEKSSFMGTNVEFFNRIIFYMRTYILLRLKIMLINTYVDLFNYIYMINYTKFEHFGPKCPVYGGNSSFMGKKVQFFIRIVFYMRTYILLRLQFMLIDTYMDLFNWTHVINYTKFEYFGPKCPVYGGKSSFIGKIIEVFNRIILCMGTYFFLRL